MNYNVSHDTYSILKTISEHKLSENRLKGMEMFMQFTLIDNVIALRTYKVQLLKSGLDQPRIELVSVGPGKCSHPNAQSQSVL